LELDGHGVLSFSAIPSSITITGNGTAALVLNGPLSAINDLLATLDFRSDISFVGQINVVVAPPLWIFWHVGRMYQLPEPNPSWCLTWPPWTAGFLHPLAQHMSGQCSLPTSMAAVFVLVTPFQ
jgi:hypothetical protein